MQNFSAFIHANFTNHGITSETDPSKRLATPQINHLSFRAPPIPLLVNHRPLRSENCSSDGVRQGHCTADFCECLHVLQAPIGAVVDLVLIGEGERRLLQSAGLFLLGVLVDTHLVHRITQCHDQWCFML